ncbi:MAG: 4-hydroxyphenylacetate 3-hydroxylase N-terminal domain-containing protein [Bacillota bacterium]|nr:4-hydroxyphenylacetate 3-hydroxylase N-terminal domain-containing protein [Bacillota bacterium]MDW7684165.1 4-hydroxyphenylacetate 3-hydroxylase N-terminal domain-containing protein [Bacillota bacterium]
MALKSREEYLASLRGMRSNIYKFGELIEDVVTDPATRRVVESHARAFDAAHDPEREELFTTVTPDTGEKVMRFNSVLADMGDVMGNMRMKRHAFRETGTCTGGLCVGWNAMNTMLAVTFEMDRDLATDYSARLQEWITHCQKQCLVVAGALTDAKGDRSKTPSMQAEPDVNVHLVEKRDDGIVVRGVKAMIAGAAAANEIFVLPGSGYREGDRDYAVSFALPRDAEGLTLVECRRPSDTRDAEAGFDSPTETGITQSYLLFDNVFVPNERVFMCGEYRYTAQVIRYFTANYRACIGGCVTGQGDVMVGAAVLMARANGLSAKKFTDKLVQMTVNNETTYGMGAGAIAMGRRHPAGVWLADDTLAHVNKVHVATLPYESKRLLQDVCGGLVETGCFPSFADFHHEEYGQWIQKSLQAGKATAESRARLARLAEWLTIGSGVPGCMHGGGSPDGAKLVVRLNTPLEEYAGYAKKLAGVDEEITEP